MTLTQTSSGGVAVQVCHTGALDHARECTVPPFARLSAGQSVSATLRGGRSQVVTVFPAACGAPSATQETVSYMISVMFPG